MSVDFYPKWWIIDSSVRQTQTRKNQMNYDMNAARDYYFEQMSAQVVK